MHVVVGVGLLTAPPPLALSIRYSDSLSLFVAYLIFIQLKLSLLPPVWHGTVL